MQRKPNQITEAHDPCAGDIQTHCGFRDPFARDWYLSRPQALAWNAAIDCNFWSERGGKDAEFRCFALEGQEQTGFQMKPMGQRQ